MEPHASIAVWEDGALTLYGAYQMPTSDAQQLAKSLGVSPSKVRIISRYIGGGFGSKLGIAPKASPPPSPPSGWAARSRR